MFCLFCTRQSTFGISSVCGWNLRQAGLRPLILVWIAGPLEMFRCGENNDTNLHNGGEIVSFFLGNPSEIHCYRRNSDRLPCVGRWILFYCPSPGQECQDPIAEGPPGPDLHHHNTTLRCIWPGPAAARPLRPSPAQCVFSTASLAFGRAGLALLVAERPQSPHQALALLQAKGLLRPCWFDRPKWPPKAVGPSAPSLINQPHR